MLWFTTPKRKENPDFFTYQRKGAIFLHFFSFDYCVDKTFTYICDVINYSLNKGTTMTIREIVLEQKPQGINQWLDFIKREKLEQYEHIIIDCANHYNLITVNHSARFDASLFNTQG